MSYDESLFPFTKATPVHRWARSGDQRNPLVLEASMCQIGAHRCCSFLPYNASCLGTLQVFGLRSDLTRRCRRKQGRASLGCRWTRTCRNRLPLLVFLGRVERREQRPAWLCTPRRGRKFFMTGNAPNTRLRGHLDNLCHSIYHSLAKMPFARVCVR